MMSPKDCGVLLLLPFVGALLYFLVLVVVALIRPEWAKRELSRQRPNKHTGHGITRIVAYTLAAWVVHQFMSLSKKH
jgi:hypothetical protein